MEKILCAAIWIDDGVSTYVHQPENIKQGFVVMGYRHCNCFTTLAMLQGLQVLKKESQKEAEKGFITSTNRFVNRKEAVEIARNANQVPSHLTILYSEDLY